MGLYRAAGMDNVGPRYDDSQGSISKVANSDSLHVVQVVTPMRSELHKAMRLKAAEEDTTIRVLVMRGLRAIGLPVSAEDEQDRRHARGNRRPAAAPDAVSKRRTISG
jgi:hypothetical protein